jgi:predicted lipoprotein with Yx(FWY)xxD motif
MLVRALLMGVAVVLTGSVAIADDYAGGAIKTTETSKGEILTNADGMTLYVFDKDSEGVSNCYDKCAANWPPLLAEAGAMGEDEFTLVERKDGAKQWAYDGKPLYLWVKDEKAGDMTGDGFGGVWHVAVEGSY